MFGVKLPLDALRTGRRAHILVVARRSIAAEPGRHVCVQHFVQRLFPFVRLAHFVDLLVLRRGRVVVVCIVALAFLLFAREVLLQLSLHLPLELRRPQLLLDHPLYKLGTVLLLGLLQVFEVLLVCDFVLVAQRGDLVGHLVSIFHKGVL